MKAPQIILIILYTFSLAVTLMLHGQYKTGKHNFWISSADACIMLFLLWWGGFFS